MGNPSAAHEPSMEEILASIRQIISEDGEQPEGEAESSDGSDASPTAEAEGAEPEMAAGEFDQEPAGEAAADTDRPHDEETAPMAAAAPEPPHSPQEPALRRQSAPPQAAASQPTQPARPSESAAQPPRAAAASGPAPQPAGQAAGAGALMASAAVPERRLLSPQADASVSGAFSALAHTILAQNARTLEDLVSEMLRPMLKEWLDDNLPPLVERLVKEEIERVSRGRH